MVAAVAGALIFGVGATLQLAAPPPPSMVTVRSGGAESSIPLVETSSGLALRADRLATALGGSLELTPSGRATLVAGSVRVGLIDQAPFATMNGEVVPLAGAPFRDADAMYVPFEIVSELLPRASPELVYDPVRAELRRVRVVSRGAADPASSIGGGAAGASSATADTAGPAASSATHRRVVVVDAGHGGPDNGMSGTLAGMRRLYEKDVTLQVARRLGDALETRGFTVVMTRATDTLIALSDRGRIANQKKGDVFISIHVNAANPRWADPAGARGFETYFLAEAKTEDARRVERMENEAVRFETGANAPKGDPLSFVINDMAQNEHLRESSDFAARIQQELARVHPGPSRGVKQANFAVLRNSYMPAVLVEIGFGTNRGEALYLDDPARQQQLAAAIADATAEYLARYERRVGGARP